jgi:hypothetical protein
LGYGFGCKACRLIIDRQWRKDNKDKITERNLNNKAKRQAFYQSELGVESSRRAHLKRMFNLTLEDYNKMFEEQNGVCAVCNQPEPSSRLSFLCVDHCHDSNKIRGLLCSNSNRALGLMKDSVDIVKKAVKYLLKYKK